MKRAILTMLVLTTLSGCSFSAPQLEALYRFAVQERNVSEELAARAWTLDWLGESSEVYPVVVEDLVVFANAADVQVAFDGWQVIRVGGVLPYGRTARIEVGPDRRRLEFLEDEFPVLGTSCEPWSDASDSDGAIEWTQVCSELPEPNRILVDSEGATVDLRFYVHPSYPPLQLRRGTGDGE